MMRIRLRRDDIEEHGIKERQAIVLRLLIGQPGMEWIQQVGMLDENPPHQCCCTTNENLCDAGDVLSKMYNRVG
jgi:hypothetical protein